MVFSAKVFLLEFYYDTTSSTKQMLRVTPSTLNKISDANLHPSFCKAEIFVDVPSQITLCTLIPTSLIFIVSALISLYRTSKFMDLIKHKQMHTLSFILETQCEKLETLLPILPYRLNFLTFLNLNNV